MKETDTAAVPTACGKGNEGSFSRAFRESLPSCHLPSRTLRLSSGFPATRHMTMRSLRDSFLSVAYSHWFLKLRTSTVTLTMCWCFISDVILVVIQRLAGFGVGYLWFRIWLLMDFSSAWKKMEMEHADNFHIYHLLCGRSLAQIFSLNRYSYLKWMATPPHNQWRSSMREVGVYLWMAETMSRPGSAWLSSSNSSPQGWSGSG